jgi:ABC-type phosphate transport system substrate-binding protein
MMWMFVLAAAVAPAAGAATFKIVVNPGNPATSMTREEVSAFFMKKTKSWPDGSAVTAVDQVETSAVRGLFSDTILSRRVAAVRSYWQQQIFSGREVPPLEKKNDAEVLEYVRTNRGAIGYVSESTPTPGVKVLEIP